MSDTTPTLDTSSPQTFVAYLIDQALGNPRTKAMIGCGIRWILHGAGVALAARPVGHLFQSAASNSDWIMLAAGVVIGSAGVGLTIALGAALFESDRHFL